MFAPKTELTIPMWTSPSRSHDEQHRDKLCGHLGLMCALDDGVRAMDQDIATLDHLAADDLAYLHDSTHAGTQPRSTHAGTQLQSTHGEHRKSVTFSDAAPDLVGSDGWSF